MHRRTLCENVDSAKIKVPFYTTDIDILHVASMYSIVIHCIDISIHIDESLHPYSIRSAPLAQPKMPFGNLQVLNLWNRLRNSLSKLVFTQVDEHRCC